MQSTNTNSIPLWLQPVLWTTHINMLDLEKDKQYIIHQILAYGDIKEYQWLFRTYPCADITQIFTTVPYKDYTRPRFYFVKDAVLNLTTYQFNDKLYVKDIPRDLGYRAGQPTYKTD